MAISVAIRWNWEAQLAEDLFVVVESKLHVLGIWSAVAFESSVDSLQSSTESSGVGVDIGVPEPGSTCPSNVWIIGDLVRVLNETVVSVEVLRAGLVVVVPGQL